MPFKINTSILNELETEIHQKLKNAIKDTPTLTIKTASEICNVSPSKISKFCKKIGFDNYKQYKLFISTGKLVNSNETSDELKRIENYCKTFDHKKSLKLAKLISKSKRVILLGMGPSLIAIEYFAYRLRIVSTVDVLTTSEQFFINNHVSNNSLIIIYTATGKFTSYASLIAFCEENNYSYIIVCEENNHLEQFSNKKVIYLTNTTQKDKILPYEKTRTLWFIYIEEVISALQLIKN